MKLVFLLSLAALLTLPGCSRYATRTGPAPILEPLAAAPPPPAGYKPIEQEMMMPPPAETALDSPGVSLPAATALPVRKSY